MIPDETTLKEAWLSLIKAQYYVDGKIPTQDVIPYFMSPVELQAFIDGCDFSDLPKYQGYIREAMINIAECLITLGDVICQGPNGNIGLRGGILVGLSRACYAMRGLKFPEFEAEKEEPCG
jgi:hypothetical protein